MGFVSGEKITNRFVITTEGRKWVFDVATNFNSIQIRFWKISKPQSNISNLARLRLETLVRSEVNWKLNGFNSKTCL
jgi:hypothetical protein